MSAIRDAKRAGRRGLTQKGAWPRAVAILLIELLTFLLLWGLELGYYHLFGFWGLFEKSVTLTSVEPLVLGATLVRLFLTFLVLTPLRVGRLAWFYALSNGEVYRVADAFVFYASLRYACKAILLRAVTGFCRLLLCAPAVGCAGVGVWMLRLASRGDDHSGQYLVIAVCAGALALLAVIGAWILWQGFFLADYLFLENPRMSVTQAVFRSLRLLRGKKAKTAGFLFSFIGWLLAGVLALPLLYTVPYLFSSMGAYARELQRLPENTKA